MASGTLDHNLTGTYVLISGAELYVSGIVTVGSVELWYGPTGTQGTNKGIPLSAGQDFSFAMGSGDGLYARAVGGRPGGNTPVGSLTVVRRAS